MKNATTCLVTGAMGAIGKPLCTELARRGATVVMMCRDDQRGRAAVDEVRRLSGSHAVELLTCDLGSIDSVRRAATEYKARFQRLDVLINNAAVFTGTRKVTADGFEQMLGINYLSHYLLTNLLLDVLIASAPSRIVCMTMPTKAPIDLDDLMSERSFKPMKAFESSKSACTHLAVELGKRLEGTGVTANAVHPGMVNSSLPREAALPLRLVFKLFGTSPEQGKEAPLYVATSPELEGITSTYFVKNKPASLPAGVDDDALRASLWQRSARLVGLQA